MTEDMKEFIWNTVVIIILITLSILVLIGCSTTYNRSDEDRIIKEHKRELEKRNEPQFSIPKLK